MKLSNLLTFCRAIPARSRVKDLEAKRVLDALAEGFKHITTYLKDSAESTGRPNHTPSGAMGATGGTPFLVAGEGITLRKLPDGSYEIGIASATALRIAKSGGGGGLAYDAENSIQLVGMKFSFVNDAASPGASKYYGTDASAVRGYHSFSVLPTPTANGQILVSSGGSWVPTTPKTISVVTAMTYSTSTHKLTYEWATLTVIDWSSAGTIVEVFEAEECSA